MLQSEPLTQSRPFLLILAGLASACTEARTKDDFAHTRADESAETCSGCHPNHFEEWRISPHAYAMKDPVFHAMVRVGQRETEGELDQFCVSCHTPIGSRSGQTPVVLDAETGHFTQPLDGLDPLAAEGVSCLVCHSITKVNSRANADFEMSVDGIRRGTIRDPAPSAAHESVFSPLHSDSDVCGTCHTVVNQRNVALEETFVEWMQSGFNGSQECQDCHMPAYRGQAARGQAEREVHEHAFVGVDVSLLPEAEFPGYLEMRDRVERLLRDSAVFDATYEADADAIEISIENKAGHALPSGATADREMWVELLVRDAAGTLVLESGTLDERGDLRVIHPARTTRPGTDPALVLYTQEMFDDPKVDDPTSTEPARLVDFLWEPNRQRSILIPPHVTDRKRYDLSTLPSGRYQASLRLLFRSFSPHLLRKLEEKGGLDPAVKERVPLVEMARVELELER